MAFTSEQLIKEAEVLKDSVGEIFGKNGGIDKGYNLGTFGDSGGGVELKPFWYEGDWGERVYGVDYVEGANVRRVRVHMPYRYSDEWMVNVWTWDWPKNVGDPISLMLVESTHAQMFREWGSTNPERLEGCLNAQPLQLETLQRATADLEGAMERDGFVRVPWDSSWVAT